MSAIIPKKLGREKIKIKGNITIIDFVCFIAFALIAFAIAFPLTIIGTIGQVMVGILVLSALMIFLIPSKKHGKRLYKLIYLYFKFKSSNKKYKKNDKNYDTSLLIPYKKLIGNIGEIGIIETVALYKEKKFYIGAIEIEGFNILNMSFDEQEKKINQLKNLWSNIDVNCSLVKINKSFDKTRSLVFLNKKINELKTLKLTDQQINSRVEQLKSNADWFENNANGEDLQNKFYIFVYANSVKQAKEALNSIGLKASNIIGFNNNILNGYDIINTIRYLLDPIGEDFNTSEIDNFKENLKDLLRLNDCTFNKTSFNCGEIYYSVSTIRDYPKMVDRCWMLALMEGEKSVVININNVKKETVIKSLQATILNLQSNMYTLNRKEMVASKSLEQELSIYNEMVSAIGFGEETIKSITPYFLNYGIEVKNLEAQTEEMTKNLKESGFIVDNLIFRQFQAFASILPKPTDPLVKEFGQEVPGITIAEGFPYLTSEVNDENGFPIGENMMGTPVILDMYKLTRDRKNHNMMIIGTSGSGKSTLAKLLLNYHASVGRKVIVIDPEREYRDLCNYHFGTWIDVGNGLNGRINPLQLFASIDEKTLTSSKSIISNHISFLEGWIKILIPDVDEKVIRCFKLMCANLYENWLENVKEEKEILKLKPEEYPIIDNLIDFIKKHKNFKEQLNDDVNVINELLEILIGEFQGFGQYTVLYNGCSTIEKNTNPFIVFDINTLFEKGQKNIIQAQLYLVTAFISSEVNENYMRNSTESFVLIDEAHLLIDKDKPIALDFIYSMVKRIRKRKGSMGLITQNPDDFLGSEDVRKKTMAMINNVQYSIIMNLLSKNLQDIKELYKSYGDGLSQEEINYISYAKQGDALLMITGFDRHTISVKVNEIQMKAFENRT